MAGLPLCAVVLLLVYAVTGAAQPFYLDAVPTLGPSPDSFRLDIYLALPYTLLNSGRSGSAGYSMRLHVERRTGEALFDSVATRTPAVTTPEGYDLWQLRVPVGRTSGSVRVEIVDLQHNTSHTATTLFTTDSLAPPDAPLRVGGLLLVRRVRSDGPRITISPLLSRTVAVGEPYYLFAEVEQRGGDTAEVQLLAQAHDASGGPVGPGISATRRIPPGRSALWMEGRGDSMPRGESTIRLTVRDAHDTSRQPGIVERRIVFEGSGGSVAFAGEEILNRIAQLRYVATGAEMEEIRSAPTLASRQERYAEFWRPHDPLPRTAINEAMEQYHRRVDEANARFRSYAAGWLTDQGRVYILYGPPDNIQRDPWRADGRVVETWIWNRRGRRLVFLDETGFGDFRLTTSLPPGERYRYER